MKRKFLIPLAKSRVYDPLSFLQTPRSQIGLKVNVLKVNVFGWIRRCILRSRLNKNQLYLPQQRDEALPEYPLFGHVLQGFNQYPGVRPVGGIRAPELPGVELVDFSLVQYMY